MRYLNEFALDDTILYSKEHTWARTEDLHITVGISDYAQDQRGEIIFVELPQSEESFEQDEAFGFVESVKTASDLYMPVGGKIIAVNQQLEEEPELVNKDPYKSGWMIKILPTDRSELDTLLKAQGYRETLNPISYTE